MAKQPAGKSGQLSLSRLREQAAACTNRDLYQNATQTVFGEGPPRARVMFVGEQPGDKEDKEGHPFVGPAGRLLDEALAAAGLARDDVYVTNVVKHPVPSPLAAHVLATVHPSSVLRAPDATRAQETALFMADLSAVAKLLK